MLAALLVSLTPDAAQQKDIGFVFGVGQLLATVPYTQLILEDAASSGMSELLLDDLFALLVNDFNRYPVELNSKFSNHRRPGSFRNADDPCPVNDSARYDQEIGRAHV